MEPNVSVPAIKLRQRAVPRRATRALDALRSPFGTLALGATAGSLAVVAIETGGIPTWPDAFAVYTSWSTVAFVAAGVYFKRWRPGNPLGSLLVLEGFLTSVVSLQGASSPQLFAVGLLVEGPVVLLLFWILLAYPSGRLDRLGRSAIRALTLFLVLLFVPRLFVMPKVSGASPLAACDQTCPPNPILLLDSQAVTDAMHHLVPVGRLLVVGAIALALALRLLRASRPRKRMLLPVTTLGVVYLALLALFGMIQTYAGSVATTGLGYGVVLSRAMLPVALLLAPLQARAFSGLALQRMLRRFERAPTLLARERVIAHTLDDPRLRVGFWLPQSRRYLDAGGIEVTRPPRESALAWTPIARGGKPFAVLVHDEGLADDPELVQAAGHALLLAVSTKLIEADLERSLSELERSRRLLLEADAADRRRLERELHATAQQQLAALRVGLELTRERAAANSAVADRLAGLGSSLDEAVADLRRIAGDLYSPVLEQAGLAAAVRDAVRRVRRPVELDVEEVGRLPPEVERSLYYCITEALSNALEHGGDGRPQLRLARENGHVVFGVRDDGPGFDPDTTSHGAGLRAIVERIAALGGTAHVVSVPGRGTRVSGSVPVPAQAGPVQGGIS